MGWHRAVDGGRAAAIGQPQLALQVAEATATAVAGVTDLIPWHIACLLTRARARHRDEPLWPEDVASARGLIDELANPADQAEQAVRLTIAAFELLDQQHGMDDWARDLALDAQARCREADWAAGRVAVLLPIGAALHRVQDPRCWQILREARSLSSTTGNDAMTARLDQLFGS